MKRRRSVTLYEYPAYMMKSKQNKIMFGGKNNKTTANEDDDDGDEPGIDFSKLFKKNTGDESYIVDNKIYFTDDITKESITKLNKQLLSLQSKLINMSNSLGIDQIPIKLYLSSHGGCLDSTLRCINTIKSLTIPLHTIVDSYAASGCTLISVVADRRYIRKYSTFLIHELRSGVSWNKYSEIENEVQNMKTYMEMIKDIYATHTKLTRAQLSVMLKKDVYFTPLQCRDYGLVDEIIE
jgi:ATP-dependent protease ClpP protease subunit